MATEREVDDCFEYIIKLMRSQKSNAEEEILRDLAQAGLFIAQSVVIDLKRCADALEQIRRTIEIK